MTPFKKGAPFLRCDTHQARVPVRSQQQRSATYSFIKSRTRTVILRFSLTGAAFCILGLLFWEFEHPDSSPVLALDIFPASTPTSRSGDLIGRAVVIDGDTIEIHGHRIRLSGIDAPEMSQSCRDRSRADYPCGRQAAHALANRLRMATVSCTAQSTDSYGRTLAICRAGGQNINAWLVSQGWAMAYRRYSRAYADEEAQARAAGRGMWQGTADDPEDWRRMN